MNHTLNIARCASIAAAVCLCSASYAQDASAPHAPPTNWNDTFLGFRYSNDFYFPGSAAKVAQKIGSVTTTGGFKYGNYYFNADYLVSDKNNPEAGGTEGAEEVYSVGHIEWSASKILGQHVGGGFIRDVGFTTGYEFGAKDDAFEERAKMLTLGPTLDFAVAHGYWNLTLGARHETNYNGITHTDLDYNTAWHLDSAWMIPFNLGAEPMVFKGFLAVTGPKGLDGFHVETTTETLMRTSLLFDVGALAGNPRAIYIGPGYEYWHNMFGTPSSEAPGTKRSAPVLVAEFHF